MTSELSLQRNDAIKHKNVIPKYLDNALTRRLLEEKAPRNDFGRTVPSAEKYCAASKIGNGVILLILQLRCHSNSDHNKFSSLSNTTVVAIFPKLCLWQRRLCSDLGGIGPEKLYRATLNPEIKTMDVDLVVFEKTDWWFSSENY